MNMTIRTARPEDAPILARFRRLMFESFLDDQAFPREDRDSFEALDAKRMKKELSTGRTVAWLSEDASGRAVAGCALTVYHLLPKPWNTDAAYGFLSSLWTEPDMRRQGLGSRLVDTALDEARRLGLSQVTLNASDMGRPIYERLGFARTNEMRLTLIP